MNSLNDTAKLYQLFGGQAGDYQELRRSDQAKLAKQRWPLLAWLDLSALHVSEAPKVQLGETPHASAAARPAPNNAPLSTPLSPQFTNPPSSHVNAPLSTSLSAPLSTPLKVPMTPMAPSLSPAARAMASKPVASTQPAWLPASPPVPAAQAVPSSAPVHTTLKPPAASVSPAINPTATNLATTSPATAPYLQQLLDPPARLQALGTAPQVVTPVASAPVTQAPSTVAAANAEKTADAGNNTLRDIFSRIAQPAPSPTNPTQPAGSLWSNLTSRL